MSPGTKTKKAVPALREQPFFAGTAFLSRPNASSAFI